MLDTLLLTIESFIHILISIKSIPLPSIPNKQSKQSKNTPLPICIHHSLRSNRKRRFILRQIGTVVHLATPHSPSSRLPNSLLPLPLLKKQPCRAGMRDDVPSDRLLRVLHELSLTPSRHSHHGRSSRIRCDLIDNHHRHIELLSHYLSPHFPISTFFQGTQMPSQLLLALCELATTAVVHAEQRGDRIDHLSEE